MQQLAARRAPPRLWIAGPSNKEGETFSEFEAAVVEITMALCSVRVINFKKKERRGNGTIIGAEDLGSRRRKTGFGPHAAGKHVY